VRSKGAKDKAWIVLVFSAFEMDSYEIAAGERIIERR